MSRFIIGAAKRPDTPGSRNYAGIKDFAVDTAATALTRAESMEDFVTAARRSTAH